MQLQAFVLIKPLSIVTGHSDLPWQFVKVKRQDLNFINKK